MKLVRESLYEKFTEDSDPIADMNIGMIHQIKLWMTSINIPFEDKDQALRICAERGKIDYVKYLLSAGADIHADDDMALHLASENGHIEVVKVLLSAGANVHAGNDMALQWASRYGHIEVVKVLLSAGADVHVSDDFALRLASGNGHIEVVKVLLNASADVHARNDNALHLASNNGHTEVVKVLKDWIAKEKKTKKTKVRESLNEKFTEDSDPITDMNIGMIHQIKLWMTSINELFEDKDQALSICAKEGKTDYVKYLLSAGADVHAFGDLALHLASRYGHTEVVKVLLSAGANVYARNDYTLHLASNNGHTEVVKVLKDWIAKEKKTKVRESLNEKFTEDSDPIIGYGNRHAQNYRTIY